MKGGGWIECPECGNYETKVVDSRMHTNGTRRRRKCLICGEKFNTLETIVDLKKLRREADQCQE